MRELDVSQLYLVSVDGKLYLRSGWSLDQRFQMLESTDVYNGDLYFLKLYPAITVSVHRYPLEDLIPEFLYMNGKIRMKGRI